MQSLLIIGYVWPEPTATAAGSRMLQIVEQFQLAKYQITFASPAHRPKTAFDFTPLNIKTVTVTLNNASFDDFIVQLNPTIVLFDRFMMEEQFGWRVGKCCPNAIRVLDSEDLHFLRKARQKAIKKNLDLPTGRINTQDAYREIASIYRCDVTLTISEFEMEYLENTYQISKALLWYLPFLVTVSHLPKPNFKSRQDFVFVGNFIHAPNWDTVLQLKHKIWPLIKKQLPKANLHIYGAYPSEKVFQLHNEQHGFLVHGRVQSVHKVMQQARVCLAPLRFGAGLKGKLIDAMQNNTPFVTTKIGAEGMFGDVNFKESIAFNENDFIEKATRLYTDEQQWYLAQEKGLKILQTRFDKILFQDAFAQKLEMLTNNIKTHRDQNFIGNMLQHHALKSTMYLSKWIAEKNKV